MAAHGAACRPRSYAGSQCTPLLIEGSRMADAAARTPERQRKIDEAPTARQALRESIALQAVLKPELRGIATALDVLRRTDPAADAAWTEREHARLQRCEAVITRLHNHGDLAAEWEPSVAARLPWATASQRGWSGPHGRQGRLHRR